MISFPLLSMAWNLISKVPDHACSFDLSKETTAGKSSNLTTTGSWRSA